MPTTSSVPGTVYLPLPYHWWCGIWYEPWSRLIVFTNTRRCVSSNVAFLKVWFFMKVHWLVCSYTYKYMGVSKIGVPQNGRCIMENPIKMDDLGVPLFSETSIYTYEYIYIYIYILCYTYVHLWRDFLSKVTGAGWAPLVASIRSVKVSSIWFTTTSQGCRFTQLGRDVGQFPGGYILNISQKYPQRLESLSKIHTVVHGNYLISASHVCNISTLSTYCWWFRNPAITTWDVYQTRRKEWDICIYFAISTGDRRISEPSTVSQHTCCWIVHLGVGKSIKKICLLLRTSWQSP